MGCITKVLITAAALGGFISTTNVVSAADDYPSQTVTIVVPFAAGGSNDSLTRLIARGLQDRLGQTFIVENRSGAGGNLGASVIARAPADGHHLVMGSIGTHAVNAALYREMPYDTVEDFEPITLVAAVELVLVVHPSLDVHSVSDLIEYAKSHPGQLDYASGGNGASQHLAGELFKQLADVDLVHIPYNGSGDAIADVLGGQVQVMFADMPLVAAHIEEGRLRPLAVGSLERTPSVDVPTMHEEGVEQFEANAWYGLFAPAGTPDTVVQKLHLEIADILNDEENQEFLSRLGAVPVGNTPEEFAEFQASEMERWGALIEPLGLRLD